jgi:hypothetical protein
MINKSLAQIKSLAIHHIGSKHENEGIKISEQTVEPDNETLTDLLSKYFFCHFKEPDFFKFTFSNDDVNLNPVYQFARAIFNNPQILHNQSVFIAKHLYDKSNHPNIKSGDLIVAYIENISVNDEMADAIGIFKVESKDGFLKLNHETGRIDLNYETGINVEKPDKACLIMNLEESDGYKVCIIDKSNKNNEAHFWKNDFLNITEKNDDYHATKNYIELTQAFIKDRLIPLYELEKTEEAAILHRSKEFFKKVERFEDEDYEERVFFENDKIINDFKEFKADFQQEKNINLETTFFVDPKAVKKQSRFFRSVLKLDKNFHIYIHGNHDLIERGRDEKGTFYKVYFEEES